MASEQLGLADLFTALRAEINKAVENLRQSGEAAMFELKEAEVEIHFVATREGKGKAGVDIPGLFAVELGGTYKAENLHKLKVTLKPKPTPEGKGPDIAGSKTGE